MRRLFQKTSCSLLLVFLLVGGLTGCSKHSAAGKNTDVDYWTCTMHPSVHSNDPGKCPICS
ncbi:MAG TPA: heavy metal-binding domain-containing protein, partial [Chthoniobacterales bacterium]|nr:heavy metal-binding domain-containing protein [Chthoniobacterales bacterium]